MSDKLSAEVGEAVRVIWLDHVSGPRGWHELDDLPKVLSVVTYGLIVAKDDLSITVSSSLGWDRGKQTVDPDESVGDTTAIVLSCVEKIDLLAIEPIMR